MEVLKLLVVFYSWLCANQISAGTIKVSSVADLQNAITNTAVAGDVILLADGTYLNNTINITKSNITVRAVTLGGVFLNGTNAIKITGNYVTFSGFQFTSGDIGTGVILTIGGSHCLVSQLNFSGYFAQKYIVISAGTQYNEIAYCNIEKKPAAAVIGNTIQISTSATIPGYHKIRYCSFQNFFGVGGDNGNEPVRIGLGVEALNNSRTIVEYCFWNNTGLGDSESVSVKSRENTIRYCTFTNQQNAMLVFRNGDNNAATHSFLLIEQRAMSSNNIYCYNNYFENSGIGSIANAVTYIYVAPDLNNINFIHNTFVNCGDIDFGGVGPTNNTWANNIFKKATTGAGNIFKNPNNAVTWAGNIYQGTLGISIPSGMKNVDPLLTKNADGYFGLSAVSPAIDSASASYPAIIHIDSINDDPNILLDIAGKTRPASKILKDVGCDEFTTVGKIINRPLKVTDVGPSYLGGPTTPVINLSETTNISVYPNPTNGICFINIEKNNSEKTSTSLNLSIYDVNGKLVKTFPSVENCFPIRCDVSDLPNGIFWLKLSGSSQLEGVVTTKLFIQK